MEGKLIILETNQESEEITHFYDFIPYFVHLETFIVILLRGNVHGWLGCTAICTFYVS